MKVFFGLNGDLPTQLPVIMTIGNFDGMHKGHQDLVDLVQAHAKKIHGVSLVMTFDPHPMKVLFPQRGLKNIFTLDDRIEILKSKNVDFLLIEPFSRELSQLTPDDFFTNLLQARMNLKALYVGHDFSFGKNRQGSLTVLEKLCVKHSVELHVMPPVKINDDVVSSTKIRDAILDGDVKKAHIFLNRPFYLEGIIEKGAGRGKKLNIPTANLFTRAELFPKNGVYITNARVDGHDWISVTNIGFNPTFTGDSGQRPLQIETHILDFDKDIYGQPLRVTFYDYIRPELRFNSVQELVAQITDDITRTRLYPWEKF
ncbi:MAG: bifunctional riboflavin kinase/FAD synthetase [Oligoflexia bacterium]|nr:bifunctional riboflavin kinase/FAD synthetase [Oligoflexia bacterium]